MSQYVYPGYPITYAAAIEIPEIGVAVRRMAERWLAKQGEKTSKEWHRTVQYHRNPPQFAARKWTRTRRAHAGYDVLARGGYRLGHIYCIQRGCWGVRCFGTPEWPRLRSKREAESLIRHIDRLLTLVEADLIEEKRLPEITEDVRKAEAALERLSPPQLRRILDHFQVRLSKER